jgi:hemoglobin
MVYTGRDMRTVHIGMGLDEEDWNRAIDHLTATLEAFEVPEQEKDEVLAFSESLKPEIVEIP